MGASLGQTVQRFLQEMHSACAYPDSSTLSKYLGAHMQLQCLVPLWHSQDCSLSQILPSLNALSASTPVPVQLSKPCQQWKWEECVHAMEAAPALLPIIQFMYTAGGPAKSVITGQDRQHAVPNLQCTTTSLADSACRERVTWLRAAFVVAKMASCVQYTNREESPNTLIWGCLSFISNHLSSAPATITSEEVRHEEKALCTLLTQTMLSVLRWSAKHHQQPQYAGQAALSILLGVVNCEAVDLASLADLMLKSGFIVTFLAALRHDLQWAAGSFSLLRAIITYVQPHDYQLILHLHGLSLVSKLVRPRSAGGQKDASAMKKQQGPNTHQHTAVHDESNVETTADRVSRVVAAAGLMERVLAVRSGCPISPSSPDVSPDTQAESTTKHAARLLAEDCIQASLMALKTMRYIQQSNCDWMSYDNDVEEVLEELIHSLLLPHMPDLEISLISVFQIGLPLLMDLLSMSLLPRPGGWLRDLLVAFMDRLACDPHLGTAVGAAPGSVLMHKLDQLAYAMSSDSDELVEEPLSLHVVYGLLSNKELAAWLGTKSLEACHNNLIDALDDIWDEDALEPSWLAAACVVKMWGLHDLAIDDFFDHQFFLVTTCLSMVYQSGGMWSNAECIAAARLLSSLSTLPSHLEASFPAGGDVPACLRFMRRIDSLSTDASCRAALTEAAIGMLSRSAAFKHPQSHPLADSQGPGSKTAGIKFLTDLYMLYMTSPPSTSISEQSHDTVGARPELSQPVQTLLLRCIWVAGLRDPDSAPAVAYFYQHAFTATLRSCTAVCEAAWPAGPEAVDACKELCTFYNILAACHEHMWGKAGFVGSPPPQGVAPVLRVLLYLQLDSLLHMAQKLKEGQQATIRQKRQHLACRSSEVAHTATDTTARLRDMQVKVQSLRNRICEAACGVWMLRGHSAWKQQFDALQTPKTDEEAAMQTKMWQHLCSLDDCSYITGEVCSQIAHTFYRDQDQVKQTAAEEAAQWLLAQEAAAQGQASTKRAKKQRQKARKQSAQQILLAEAQPDVPASPRAQAQQDASDTSEQDTALADHALLAQTAQGSHLAQPCPKAECAEDAACVPHIQQPEHGSGELHHGLGELQHGGGTGGMPQLSRPVDGHDTEQPREAALSMMSTLHIHATSRGCTDVVACDTKHTAPRSEQAPVSSTQAVSSSEQALAIGVLANLLSCPLTKAVMCDPVIAGDGHTYERHAMEAWLRHHDTSPVTGTQLPHLRLLPNVIIRSAVRTQQQG